MAEVIVEMTSANPGELLERMFRRIEKPKGGDLSKIASTVRRGFADNFASESSAEGPWKPLAAMTVAERVAAGYGGEHPILQRTGSLRKSFTDAGSSGHVERYEPQSDGWIVTVGSMHELAAFHEFGTRRMPARPITPLQARAVRAIEDAVSDFIAQIERSAVGR